MRKPERDPHEGDRSKASFNSQISKVFKLAGKEDRFIAMADRWLPGTHVDARLADIFTRVIAGSYAPDRFQATDEERREMYAANVMESAHTAISDYVWLPIRLIPPGEDHPQGRVLIGWVDTWRWEDL